MLRTMVTLTKECRLQIQKQIQRQTQISVMVWELFNTCREVAVDRCCTDSVTAKRNVDTRQYRNTTTYKVLPALQRANSSHICLLLCAKQTTITAHIIVPQGFVAEKQRQAWKAIRAAGCPHSCHDRSENLFSLWCKLEAPQPKDKGNAIISRTMKHSRNLQVLQEMQMREKGRTCWSRAHY